MAKPRVFKKHELESDERQQQIQSLLDEIRSLPEIGEALDDNLSPGTVEQLKAFITALKQIHDFNFHQRETDERFYALLEPAELTCALASLNSLLKKSTGTIDNQALLSAMEAIKQRLECGLSYHYRNERIWRLSVSAGLMLIGSAIFAGACVLGFVFSFAILGLLGGLLGAAVLVGGAYSGQCSSDRDKALLDSRIPDIFSKRHKHSDNRHPLTEVAFSVIYACRYLENRIKVSQNSDSDHSLGWVKSNRDAKVALLKQDLARINSFLEKQDDMPASERTFLEKMQMTLNARIRTMEKETYLGDKQTRHALKEPNGSCRDKTNYYSQNRRKALYPKGALTCDFKEAKSVMSRMPSIGIERRLSGLAYGSPLYAHTFFFTHSRKLNRELVASDEFNKFCSDQGYSRPDPTTVRWGVPQPQRYRDDSSSDSDSMDDFYTALAVTSLVLGK